MRQRILAPAVERADTQLSIGGREAIGHATMHDLRRTYMSLLYHAGATPREVMEQAGHTDPALALRIYAAVLKRNSDLGRRLDELVLDPQPAWGPALKRASTQDAKSE